MSYPAKRGGSVNVQELADSIVEKSVSQSVLLFNDGQWQDYAVQVGDHAEVSCGKCGAMFHTDSVQIFMNDPYCSDCYGKKIDALRADTKVIVYRELGVS